MGDGGVYENGASDARAGGEDFGEDFALALGIVNGIHHNDAVSARCVR